LATKAVGESLDDYAPTLRDIIELLKLPYDSPPLQEKLITITCSVSDNLSNNSSIEEVRDEFARMLQKTGIGAQLARRKAKSWIQVGRELDAHHEESLFQICFALGLNAWQAKSFIVNTFNANIYNFRNIKHVIYSFCLHYGFTYSETKRLLIYYLSQPLLPKDQTQQDFVDFTEQIVFDAIDESLVVKQALKDMQSLISFLRSPDAKEYFDWREIVVSLLERIPNETYLIGLDQEVIECVGSVDYKPDKGTLHRFNVLRRQRKLNRQEEIPKCEVERIRKYLDNEKEFSNRKKQKQLVCSLINSLRSINDGLETNKSKLSISAVLEEACGSKSKGDNTLHFINKKCWSFLLDAFLDDLSEHQNLILAFYAREQIGGSVDELEQLLLKTHYQREGTKDKLRLSASRHATTEKIVNIMKDVLQTGAKLDQKALGSCREEPSEQAKSKLAWSFINLKEVSEGRGSFIGYSKTAYGEYLVMKRDVVHRLIKRCLRSECGDTGSRKPYSQKASAEFASRFWSEMFAGDAIAAINDYKEYRRFFEIALGKSDGEWQPSKVFAVKMSLRGAEISEEVDSIVDGLLREIGALFRSRSQVNSREPLRGLCNEVAFLGKIVSNVQTARFICYDIAPSDEDTVLFDKLRSGVSGKTKTKVFRDMGIREWPNPDSFNDLDNDPSMIANPYSARGILYLQRFFYHATMPNRQYSPIGPSADSRRQAHQDVNAHGGRVLLYNFLTDLTKLSYECGLAYPCIGIKFDYLLLKAIYEMGDEFSRAKEDKKGLETRRGAIDACLSRIKEENQLSITKNKTDDVLKCIKVENQLSYNMSIIDEELNLAEEIINAIDARAYIYELIIEQLNRSEG